MDRVELHVSTVHTAKAVKRILANLAPPSVADYDVTLCSNATPRSAPEPQLPKAQDRQSARKVVT